MDEQTNPPEPYRKTMKKLLRLGVSKVHFKCNGLRYARKDGIAMGVFLIVNCTARSSKNTNLR